MDQKKSDHQLRIEAFMKLADGLAPGKQGVPSVPTIPSQAVRLLRARLIMEEAMETVHALGFYLGSDFVLQPGDEISMIEIEFFPRTNFDIQLTDIADGCADLSVVTIGTLSACGLPDTPILEEVDANNLAKFGPGSSADAHGKLVKPPNHKRPDLAGVIARLGE